MRPFLFHRFAVAAIVLAGPLLSAADGSIYLSVVNDAIGSNWIIGRVGNTGGGTLSIEGVVYNASGNRVSPPNQLPFVLPGTTVKSSCVLTFKGKTSEYAIIRLMDDNKKTYDFKLVWRNGQCALETAPDPGNVPETQKDNALTVLDASNSQSGMTNISIKKATF